MTTGERIKQYALLESGDLESFAQSIGWKWHRLYPVITGKEEAGIALLIVLARSGCNINWLLTGDGNPLVGKESVVDLVATQAHYPGGDQGFGKSPGRHGSAADGSVTAKNTEVELLDIAAISPKAIRSLNIQIKNFSK